MADNSAMQHPPRVAWRDFPDAVLLASERETLSHPEYAAPKSGGAVAVAAWQAVQGDRLRLARYCRTKRPCAVEEAG